jgi:hypothetical protein
MSYQLLNGRMAETVIDDNCGISKFYAIAAALSNDLQVTFLNQIDDVETMDWDFSFKGKILTLHFDVYGGVSIVENHLSTDNAVSLREDIADWLQRKLF